MPGRGINIRGHGKMQPTHGGERADVLHECDDGGRVEMVRSSRYVLLI